MGISVSIIRVPLEPAVDVLSQRMDLSAFTEYLETELVPYDPAVEPRADLDPSSPELHLWKSYGLLLDVFTERAHEHHSSLFITDEFPDPLAWAAFGARLAGWKGDPYPLRYSLGSDLAAICDALEALDKHELQRCLRRVLALTPKYEQGHGPWAQSYVEKVIPVMPEFYRRARGAGEIVIHRMF